MAAMIVENMSVINYCDGHEFEKSPLEIPNIGIDDSDFQNLIIHGTTLWRSSNLDFLFYFASVMVTRFLQ